MTFSDTQAGGTATVNILDAASTNSNTGVIDSSREKLVVSGLRSAQQELASIRRPGRDRDEHLHGRRHGSTAGATMNMDNPAAGEARNYRWCGFQNTFNVGGASLPSGLGGVAGPVVSTAAPARRIALPSTTSPSAGQRRLHRHQHRRDANGWIRRPDLGIADGSLILNAENFLPTDGNNTININSTANGTNTYVNGDNGDSTINVNGTGTSGSLNVATGVTGTSTVNVAASQLLTILGYGETQGPDTVNIGDAPGGEGTLANIAGQVFLVALDDPIVLNVNDQGDAAQRYNFAIQLGEAKLALGIRPAFLSVAAEHLASLTLSGSALGNTFKLEHDARGHPTAHDAGAGNDTINIQGTGTGSFLYINGQGGLGLGHARQQRQRRDHPRARHDHQRVG